MQYLIGVDIGTSATKTILMDENGEILSQTSRSYPMMQPANGWAEQRPDDWLEASIETIRFVVEESGVDPAAVKGIGLSGQMHGLVMLDENDKPIRDSIIWCDQRSHEQLEEMTSSLPFEKWLEITANPPIAAWTAAKILWVRKHEPENLAKCRHILLPKDYVRFGLTGDFATDVSDASGMQLMDVKNRCWSDEVLEAVKIDKALLPKIYESAEVTGYLTKEAAEKCGLTTQCAVVGGSADNAGAAIGSGIVLDGDAFTSIGTSAIVYTALDNYKSVPEGSLHLCCSSVPGGYFTMGGPQAAGLSVEWFREKFCRGLAEEAKESGKPIFELINEKTAEIKPGSDRLIYLPFLMGERTPHMNAKYRGAFVGLNTVHGQAHMLRAIMEGITYSLADCNDILKGMGTFVKEMRVCGGGSRNPVWRQIMADLYECDVVTLTQEEGPAYGEAILAGVGTGVFDDVRTAAKKLTGTDKKVSPNPEEVDVYRKYHKIYQKVYDHLVSDFDELYEV